MITDREIALEKELTETKRLVVKLQLAMISQQTAEIDRREKSVNVESRTREEAALKEQTKTVVPGRPQWMDKLHDKRRSQAQREIAALERDRVHGTFADKRGTFELPNPVAYENALCAAGARAELYDDAEGIKPGLTD